VAGYLDWRGLIRDPQIDLVDITLPTALHAQVAVAALDAGKHVLCEKPMALSAADCQPMMDAAKRNDRRLLIAHVLPFFPEYAWAIREVRSGKHGELLGGNFQRISAEPTWMANYWSPEHLGGPMLDLHVHDAHFIQLLFGRPTSVKASGSLRGEMPEFWNSQFEFAGRSLAVRATGGICRRAGVTFEHGFEIQLTNATLAFQFTLDRGQGRHLLERRLHSDASRVEYPELYGGDPVVAFVEELKEVCRAIEEGLPSEQLSPELAWDAIRICEAEQESLLTGRSDCL
jgi:predicted dehydrogenase